MDDDRPLTDAEKAEALELINRARIALDKPPLAGIPEQAFLYDGHTCVVGRSLGASCGTAYVEFDDREAARAVSEVWDTLVDDGFVALPPALRLIASDCDGVRWPELWLRAAPWNPVTGEPEELPELPIDPAYFPPRDPVVA